MTNAAPPALTDDERRARASNKADLWDGLWADRGQEAWRAEALSRVHTRIERSIPKGASVVDIGGGPGVLAARLIETRGCRVEVWDSSIVAVASARLRGARAFVVDLEDPNGPTSWPASGRAGSWVVMTEVLEHLSAPARHRILTDIRLRILPSTPRTDDDPAHQDGPAGSLMLSVPNNILGPDEEPQHAVKFSAVSLAAELRAAGFASVRVEAMGPFLLATAGKAAEKRFKLAVTLPVRDEERDIEATLASFRGVADVIVLGVDPRTKDRTREVAAAYADDVFDLVEPEGPDPRDPNQERVPPGGVHFGWLRNQCIERCKAHGVDWVFMTEGHERLAGGQDTVLRLDEIEPKPDVLFVMREGDGQRWAFPWLARPNADIFYKRSTHNILTYPDGTVALTLPHVRTAHDRHHENAKARATQRSAQNPTTLLDDWKDHGNLASLFYLGQEERARDPDKAIGYLEEFIAAASQDGAARYHARLILAKLYGRTKRWEDCRRILLPAAGDDWSRTEHFIWLGDVAFENGRLEEALQFYRYAGTVVGEPPLTTWWVDLACYSYLPAQRLSSTCALLGRLDESLRWAERVWETLPDDEHPAVFEECRRNMGILREAVAKAQAPR